MRPEPTLFFPPFHLDPVNQQLWRGPRLLPLRPKTFAVLLHLVEHAGVLVTREALVRAVWAGAHGAEGLPKKSVHELRKVMGDEAGAPRFIETLARRGWRFIAPLAPAPPRSSPGSAHHGSDPAMRAPHSTVALVGREAELAQLHGWLDRALGGERQVAFVTGEPGIGKTAVVDAFVQQLPLDGTVCLAWGQCVEHHGAGEAYLPVLEALARLGHGADGDVLLRLLRRHAPTWLVQMPALIEDPELAALQRKVLGAAQERMLREMAEALEALTAERPLLIWLEDLQWSDYSTLDLILCLARRRGPARLLLIGTYRPADVAASEHPLRAVKQELQGHGQCVDLALRFLTAAEVTQYLVARFGAGVRDLGGIIHQNTDGNPLFMVNMVDYLTARGAIGEVGGQWQVRGRLEDVAGGVPDSLRQLIEQQFDRLSKREKRALEAASVVGAEFTARAVAAALAEPEERVEEWCEGLARRGHFLASRGTDGLPNGTLTGRYRFLHALYQKALYERLAVARRIRLHRQVAEDGELLYGDRVGEIAAELAMHFERGQDRRRAVRYLSQAARNSLRRSANREAIDLLARALQILMTLPDTAERAQQELELQVTLGVPLMMTKGYTAPEVKNAYERARELCQEIGQTPHLFPVLVGLSRFHYGRNSARPTRGFGEQLLGLAHSGPDASLLLVAHMMLGGDFFFQGEFAQAQTHAEQGISLYDPLQHRALIFLYGDDPEVLCFCWAALARWYLGYPDQALERIYQALRIAEDLSYPFGLTFARFWTALIHQSRREVQRTEEQAEALVTFAHAQGIPQFAAMGTILRGWARAERGHEGDGIAEIRHGMDDLRTIGQELGRPYFSAVLAEAYRRRGHIAEGLQVLTEALAITHKTGECMHQAELYRLQGELLLNGERGTETRQGAVGIHHALEAEGCFQKALEIAHRQSATSLELRAATSLGRLWQGQGKAKDARAMVAGIYQWFTEGFETRDLQDAQALLSDLDAHVQPQPTARRTGGARFLRRDRLPPA